MLSLFRFFRFLFRIWCGTNHKSALINDYIGIFQIIFVNPKGAKGAEEGSANGTLTCETRTCVILYETNSHQDCITLDLR